MRSIDIPSMGEVFPDPVEGRERAAESSEDLAHIITIRLIAAVSDDEVLHDVYVLLGGYLEHRQAAVAKVVPMEVENGNS